MKNYLDVQSSERKNLKTVVYLLLAALTLGVGLTFASTAHGAPQQQTQGSISGTVTLGDAGAEGVTVELRQHANSGAETLLSTATSDASGHYVFVNQPSAPGDAFYYIQFQGGPGTLASWRTFPIIYLTGSDFTVPTVDISDVPLVEPAGGATVAPGSKLKWKARRAGETYRLYIYASGQGDKPVVDSGSLGAGTEYTLGQGGLAEGKYEAIVQVRDAVIGFGYSRTRFQFSIGKLEIAPTEQVQPQETTPIAPTAQPTVEQIIAPTTPPQQSEGGEAAATDNSPVAQPTPQTAAQPTTKPAIQVRLSADKTSVDQGQSLVYVIEVHNTGDGAATDVVVTDQLPAGVTVDPARMRSTHGSVAAEGNTVTASLGEVAANSTAQVEIPVQVGPEVNSALSNQASAVYKQSSEAVQSNAYIAQVAEPLTAAQPAPTEAAQPSPTTQPGPTTGSAVGAAPNEAPATATVPAPRPTQVKPSAPIPQTGGSFPLALAILFLIMALLARYLRGSRSRKV
ncbi:MAG: hypothetical protein QOH93_3634 [Chloroflexia bacterium]|jgi:uncharacterized repeat protein (TIGR01451 family)|nr:hypothetical protein [Chloroflexia bacterium]